MCKDEYDLVYPFGFGTQENQVKWQKKVFASDELVSDFLNQNFDFSIFENHSQKDRAQWGHAQFFKRTSYIEGGMENENFKAWGPEDEEKHYRFPKLGYNLGRVIDWVYHLEHSRGDDSDRNNIYFHDNLILMEDIRSLSEEELKNYYNTQEYLKKYMIDLKDTTFIIPVKIESDDRLRNVITVCCFLLENFDTKVIL